MGELLFKIWFGIAVLPFLIAVEIKDKFMAFMNKDPKRWYYVPHGLVVILTLFLIILLSAGYR